MSHTGAGTERTILTAVDLVEAVKKAATLEPLGRCLTIEALAEKHGTDWEDHIGSDAAGGPEEDQEKNGCGEYYGAAGVSEGGRFGILRRLEACACDNPLVSSFAQGVRAEPDTLLTTVAGPGGELLDLGALQTEPAFGQLYAEGEPAQYGDQAELATKHDHSVRRGRTLDIYRIYDDDDLYDIVEMVEGVWRAEGGLYPSRVRAVPHSVNLYARGDMFKPHQDTPDKGMVGTFLIGVGTEGDHLTVEGREGVPASKSNTWELCGETPTWCAFYADCIHSVPGVPGPRLIVSFKIYAAEGSVYGTPTEWLVGDLPAFGYILNHLYETEAAEPKGCDKIVCDEPSKLGPITTLPVVMDVSVVKDESSEWECETLTTSAPVYPMTPAHIDFLQKGGEKPPPVVGKGTPFYISAAAWRAKIFSEYDPGALFAGNESRPACLNSVYLHRAVIVKLTAAGGRRD